MAKGGARPGAGRPRKDPDAPKTSTLINLRISLKDYEIIRKKAEAKGISVSKFLRESALNA